MAGQRLFVNCLLSTFKKFIALLVALDVLCRGPTAVSADNLCVDLIFPLGYACNDYTVETPDGFLLGIYNIPYGSSGPGRGPGNPVLLVHGFQAAGDNWVENSPQESLGTVLADAGYDVWITNNRNVQWSHGSSRYSPSDDDYWDWTWDELAAFDVPTSLNFVYNSRGGTKVFYVGHSQGTLTFFAALTSGDSVLRAQMVNQLRGAVLIAPFAYNANVQAPLLKFILGTYSDDLFPLFGGAVDVKTLLNTFCKGGVMLCEDLIGSTLGTNNFLNISRRAFYFQYFPQVTSTRNFNHFGQTKRSGLFQKYDLGPINNLIKYGQLSPPLYDLSTFPTNFPVQIFTGGVDGLATPIDTEHTLSNLPSTLVKEVVNLPNYGHIDFIIGYRAHLDCYPQLVSFLNSH